MNDFQTEVAGRIAANADNEQLKRAAREFLRESIHPKYSYNFSLSGSSHHPVSTGHRGHAGVGVAY